jgi:cell division septation protein DedD
LKTAGRLRFLVLAVLTVAAGMLGLSRWVGSGAVPWRARSGGAEAPTPARGDALSQSGDDLTFYQTLGSADPRSADRGDDLAAAPGERADRSGAYVIQALVTRSRDRAHKLRERLRGGGLRVVVSEGSVGGEVIYRVRVGRYRDRAVADLVARKIREAENLDPWVLKEAD